MTLEEQDYFRQKMQDEYGPGWESIVRDYGGMVNPKVGPAGKMTEPGMSFDPTRFRADNPLSLLSSKEDIDAVLRDPSLRTKQDWINELDHFAPNRLKESRPPMEMNTSGVPVDYYGPSGFQNEISPLPHQLEGPEKDRRTWEDRDWTPAYDPNQKLYDPNYYGTPGQMGAPPPEQINRNPGLLDEFNQINPLWNSIDSTPQIPERQETFSQAFPGSDPEEDWMKQAWQKQPGLLEGQNMKDSGWMKDQRMKDSQKRDLGLAQMLLNFGQQQSQDDHEWQDW